MANPKPEDVQFLLDNQVPQLFNEIVADLSNNMPADIHDYLIQWLSLRKAGKGAEITTTKTAPIEGQKTGTSGLRKKVEVFTKPNYLNNWVQSLFNALRKTDPKFIGSTLVLGGDGRYFNKQAAQTIIKMAFANGVRKVVVGQNGLFATPAVSAIIRELKAFGGLIMTASHNPGGPTEDWGIKYNCGGGEPAPEKITDVIFVETQQISEYYMVQIDDVDLSQIGEHKVKGGNIVEVISATDMYLNLLKSIYDFPKLSAFLKRDDVRFLLDGMNGVAGVGVQAFLQLMEVGDKAKDCQQQTEPKEDFGGLHPDPNLKYGKTLVDKLFCDNAPLFGAAFDGDADRNMILGNNFFVTPSDSVAVISQYAKEAIPYFEKNGVQGLARSMPTATSLDRVAKKLGIEVYEVPTGWKFFCNLMDSGRVSICGEESFGTGSNHIREKDGLWACLAWLSILAHRNQDPSNLVSVKQIVEEHWKEFGRSLYVRYDYENISAPEGEENPATTMINRLDGLVADNGLKGKEYKGSTGTVYTVDRCDNFTYNDPVDGSVAKKQGVRIIFTDSSRIILRLSATGSTGQTVRLYMEKVQAPDQVNSDEDAKETIKELANIAFEISQLPEITKRESPTVIT